VLTTARGGNGGERCWRLARRFGRAVCERASTKQARLRVGGAEGVGERASTEVVRVVRVVMRRSEVPSEEVDGMNVVLFWCRG